MTPTDPTALRAAYQRAQITAYVVLTTGGSRGQVDAALARVANLRERLLALEATGEGS